jgi:HD-GYP domain-containing protein (c-di-GMP phosphodiesterase class II)
MAIRNEEVQEIIRIDSELNKIRDYDLLLERILLEARRVVNADAGSIYVREGDQISIKYAQNDTKQRSLPPGEKQAYPHFSIPVNDKSISGYVAMTGRLVNIKDVYRLSRNAPYSYNVAFDKASGYKTKSMLTVPLKTPNNVVLGVIQIINAMGDDGKLLHFTKADEVLVTHFASNATVAMQRAYMTRSMIIRMIRMAELRDPKETGAHVNRVSGYALELYERWAYHHRIPVKEIEKNKDLLKLAGMLHDVGKVAISDLILKKPAKFTPEEYLIMQTHTSSGARLFDDPQSDFDTIAAEVAMTHHENWDGTGYPGWVDPATGEILRTDDEGRPLKLKGEEIPLWGRIVAIADVYDALVSKRVYKAAWNEEDVLKEIRAMSGTKFDPELVDIFFEVLPRIQEIRERYPDQE